MTTQQRKFPFNFKSNRCQKFYEIPTTRSKRSTSFGYGMKSDISNTCVLQNPPPNAYKMQSDFDANDKLVKGFTFGISREVNLQN